MPKHSKQTPAPIREMEFHWLQDGDRVRVWKNTWATAFEVLTVEDFGRLELLCKRFAIALIEQED